MLNFLSPSQDAGINFLILKVLFTPCIFKIQPDCRMKMYLEYVITLNSSKYKDVYHILAIKHKYLTIPKQF